MRALRYLLTRSLADSCAEFDCCAMTTSEVHTVNKPTTIHFRISLPPLHSMELIALFRPASLPAAPSPFYKNPRHFPADLPSGGGSPSSRGTASSRSR